MDGSGERIPPDDEHVSLVAAINEKYGSGGCSDDGGIVLPPVQCHGISVALFMKIKTTDGLSSHRRQLVVLNEQNIDKAGNLDELADMLRNVTHLDLAKNNFKNWDELCQIFARIPSLKHCDLSHNLPLSHCKLSKTTQLNFPVLSSLVLNATNIRPPDLMQILTCAPCLEELHVCFNDYSNVEQELSVCSNFPVDPDSSRPMSFHTVHVLHLNQCNLSTWGALTSLCRLFPCLEILVAPENPIKTLNLHENEQQSKKICGPSEIFGCLHSLNISKWPVDSWTDIDELRLLPILSEVRALGLPLFDSHEDSERRMLFIARLPDLTVLNGSLISPTNREEAERFFIRFYLDRNDKPDRYYELVRVHGRLNKLADVDLAPKEFADVRLIFEDENKFEHRRISLNQNVAQFKKSLRSFVDVPPNRIRLFYMDSETGSALGMEELRYPRVMLHALRVIDGDEFYIQAKPEFCSNRKRTSGSTGNESLSTSPH